MKLNLRSCLLPFDHGNTVASQLKSGALAAVVCLLACLSLSAANTGSVTGTVSNGAGAAVAGARIRIQNTSSKEIQNAVTNDRGTYAFSALADGSYELSVEHEEFRPYTKDAISIVAGSRTKVDIQLSPNADATPGNRRPDGQDEAGAADSDATGKLPKQRAYTSPLLTTKGGFLRGISRRDTMLGDLWGARKELSKVGISLDILETSEVLGNLSGGAKRSSAYDGLTQVFLQLDTQRAFHWYGGTFNVSALQIHGRNFSADNLRGLQTSSGIQANRATRLWELWYDQKFGETDRFDLKIGQQSLDQEFMVSQNALLFVNTMFGWAMLPSADMPGGGPAYPLSALGARGRLRLANSWTLLAGVFSGNPMGNRDGDAQEVNSSGTSFPLNGALTIAELQYSYPSVGTMVYGNKRSPLPRVYKLGFWHDTTKFDDQRFDNTGLSLAHPGTTGVPLTHRGDYAFYGVADQMIWQHPDEYDRSLNVFVRAMGTPLADRNLVDFSLNAGITFNEPIKHRDDDVFGVGMGYAHVSSRAAGLDRDTALYSASPYSVRGGETFVEVSYRYQFKSWWQWQPTFQYVFNPGAGITDPDSSTGKRAKNETILGLRMNFAF